MTAWLIPLLCLLLAAVVAFVVRASRKNGSW
jgi:hypothetical protein